MHNCAQEFAGTTVPEHQQALLSPGGRTVPRSQQATLSQVASRNHCPQVPAGNTVPRNLQATLSPGACRQYLPGATIVSRSQHSPLYRSQHADTTVSRSQPVTLSPSDSRHCCHQKPPLSPGHSRHQSPEASRYHCPKSLQAPLSLGPSMHTLSQGASKHCCHSSQLLSLPPVASRHRCPQYPGGTAVYKSQEPSGSSCEQQH